MLTEARKPLVNDPSRLLRRADAPRDLVEWSKGRTVDELWDECDRGDWLMWLAIVDRVPVIAMVEAATACARAAVKAMPKNSKRKPLTRALKAAQDLESSVTCEKRAKACEELSGNPDASAYRDNPPTKLAWAAAAAACAARAAEALLAAEARRTAERDHEGRIRAAGIGAGDQIISRGDFPPMVYEPEDELMAMCVHASETAVAFATRTLAPEGATGEQLESVEAELSELAFEILDPVRTGLKRGRDPRELVRVLDIEPYGATESTKSRQGNELAPIEELGKKPASALAAGLIFPLGGAHLYAGHTTTGALLLLGGLASLFGVFSGVLSGFAFATIVLADLGTALQAVRQHNEGKVPRVEWQVAYGAAAVLLAMFLGLNL